MKIVTEQYELIEGDCLEVMKRFPDKYFHAIIADLPYQSTNCTWDSMIPLKPMWEQFKRLVKPGGAIVLFGSQPFTSLLVCSNLEWFKWADVWRKSHATGHLNCNVMPLRQHEDILIFGDGRITYNPQITIKPIADVRPSRHSKAKSSCYGSYRPDAETTIPLNMSYPRSVVGFNSPNHGEKGLHPTQKPVDLLAYLIRTYTNPGEVILDCCFGSGTTGVACMETGRKFVGIEQDSHYFDVGLKRIADAVLAAQGKPKELRGTASDLADMPLFASAGAHA